MFFICDIQIYIINQRKDLSNKKKENGDGTQVRRETLIIVAICFLCNFPRQSQKFLSKSERCKGNGIEEFYGLFGWRGKGGGVEGSRVVLAKNKLIFCAKSTLLYSTLLPLNSNGPLIPNIASFKCNPINSKSGAISPIQPHLTVLLILWSHHVLF